MRRNVARRTSITIKEDKFLSKIKRVSRCCTTFALLVTRLGTYGTYSRRRILTRSERSASEKKEERSFVVVVEQAEGNARYGRPRGSDTNEISLSHSLFFLFLSFIIPAFENVIRLRVNVVHFRVRRKANIPWVEKRKYYIADI